MRPATSRRTARLDSSRVHQSQHDERGELHGRARPRLLAAADHTLGTTGFLLPTLQGGAISLYPLHITSFLRCPATTPLRRSQQSPIFPESQQRSICSPVAVVTDVSGRRALPRPPPGSAAATTICHVPLPGRPSLAESGLVPDVVDAVASGSGVGLEVAFSGDAPIAGGLLTPASSAAQPAVRITGGAEGELYTLVSADPDGPDPEAPTFREVLHWIVTNIPGGSSDVTAGHEVRRAGATARQRPRRGGRQRRRRNCGLPHPSRCPMPAGDSLDWPSPAHRHAPLLLPCLSPARAAACGRP